MLRLGSTVPCRRNQLSSSLASFGGQNSRLLLAKTLLHRRRNHEDVQRPPFKVVFLGSDEFSIEVLKPLHEAKEIWESLKVVTTGIKTGVGRNKQETYTPPLMTWAQRQGILTYLYDNDEKWKPPHLLSPPPDGLAASTEERSRHLLVVASFGKYLPQTLLRGYDRDRRLNVHPSLLPHLRGPSPIQEAILWNHDETGVCVIGVEKAMDSGDIWAQDKVTLYNDETFLSLRPKLGLLGGRLLVDVMRKMLAGQAESREQGDDVSYCGKLTERRSNIRWRKHSAAFISRMSRAFGHQYPPKTTFRGMNGAVKVIRLFDVAETKLSTPELTHAGMATYVDHTKRMHVRCFDGSEVTFKYVRPDVGKMMDVKMWRNGLPRKVVPFGRDDPVDEPESEEVTE